MLASLFALLGYDCTAKQVLRGFLNVPNKWDLQGCTHLDLTRYVLGKEKQLVWPNMFFQLMEALKTSDVTSLDLTDCSLTDEDIGDLAKALPHTQLASLMLEMNPITSIYGFPKLLESLPGSRLRVLNVNATSIATTHHLGTMLLRSPLKQLHLSRTNFNDASGLVYALQNNAPLEVLGLSSTGITDGSVLRIAESLASNTHLRRLTLSSGVTDTGARALFGALQNSHSLKELDLSRNVISEASGLSLLAALLQRPPKSVNVIIDSSTHWRERMVERITDTIKLGNQSVSLVLNWKVHSYDVARCVPSWSLHTPACTLADDDSLKRLASALKSWSSLRTLDLSGQALGAIGLAALGDALPHSRIVVLRLDSCEIQDGGLEALSAALAKDPPFLQKLSLRNVTIRSQGWLGMDLAAYQLGDKESASLFVGLGTNSHLQRLVLSDNGLTRFDGPLSNNSALRTVDLRGNAHLASIKVWLDYLTLQPEINVKVKVDQKKNQNDWSLEIQKLERLQTLSRVDREKEKDMLMQVYKRRELLLFYVQMLFIFLLLLTIAPLRHCIIRASARMDSCIEGEMKRDIEQNKTALGVVSAALVEQAKLQACNVHMFKQAPFHAPLRQLQPPAMGGKLTPYGQKLLKDLNSVKLEVGRSDLVDQIILETYNEAINAYDQESAELFRDLEVRMKQVQEREAELLATISPADDVIAWREQQRRIWDKEDDLWKMFMKAREDSLKDSKLQKENWCREARQMQFFTVLFGSGRATDPMGEMRFHLERIRGVEAVIKDRAHEMDKVTPPGQVLLGPRAPSGFLMWMVWRTVCALNLIWTSGWRFIIIACGVVVGASTANQLPTPQAAKSIASWFHDNLMLFTRGLASLMMTTLLGEDHEYLLQVAMLPLAFALSFAIMFVLILLAETSLFLPMPRGVRAKIWFYEIGIIAALSFLSGILSSFLCTKVLSVLQKKCNILEPYIQGTATPYLFAGAVTVFFSAVLAQPDVQTASRQSLKMKDEVQEEMRPMGIQQCEVKSVANALTASQ